MAAIQLARRTKNAIVIDDSDSDSDSDGPSASAPPKAPPKAPPLKVKTRGNNSQKRFANRGGTDGAKKKFRRPNPNRRPKLNPAGMVFDMDDMDADLSVQLGIDAATGNQAAAAAAAAAASSSTSRRHLRPTSGKAGAVCVYPDHPNGVQVAFKCVKCFRGVCSHCCPGNPTVKTCHEHPRCSPTTQDEFAATFGGGGA